jgi:hypothetical protein
MENAETAELDSQFTKFAVDGHVGTGCIDHQRDFDHRQTLTPQFAVVHDKTFQSVTFTKPSIYESSPAGEYLDVGEYHKMTREFSDGGDHYGSMGEVQKQEYQGLSTILIGPPENRAQYILKSSSPLKDAFHYEGFMEFPNQDTVSNISGFFCPIYKTKYLKCWLQCWSDSITRNFDSSGLATALCLKAQTKAPSATFTSIHISQGIELTRTVTKPLSTDL